jgi:hypothetical protein
MSAFRTSCVLLLLLAFAGQSVVATSSPCMMMPGPADGMPHDMSAMDHANHVMPAAADTLQPDCCGEGYCSASNCQIVPGVPSPLPPASNDVKSVLSAAVLAFPVIPPLETRFRPPIPA